MPTFTQILYHIVFATKSRQRVLRPSLKRQELFKYIWGIIRNKDCHLYRIGGVEDHVHILTSLHPTVSLADLVKTIKVSTSLWIKDQRVFPEFETWQEGYSAFTHSIQERRAGEIYQESGRTSSRADVQGRIDGIVETGRGCVRGKISGMTQRTNAM